MNGYTGWGAYGTGPTDPSDEVIARNAELLERRWLVGPWQGKDTRFTPAAD
jgi:hypothetical protein